jgi:hypothetical protein
MSIVLLGAGGFQGKAALYDLSRRYGLPGIIAADWRPNDLEGGYHGKGAVVAFE